MPITGKILQQLYEVRIKNTEGESKKLFVTKDPVWAQWWVAEVNKATDNWGECYVEEYHHAMELDPDYLIDFIFWFDKNSLEMKRSRALGFFHDTVIEEDDCYLVGGEGANYEEAKAAAFMKAKMFKEKIADDGLNGE
jgi:hypothetical protein